MLTIILFQKIFPVHQGEVHNMNGMEVIYKHRKRILQIMDRPEQMERRNWMIEKEKARNILKNI